MKYEWMDQALCAQVDPDLWFPEGSGQHAREALQLCSGCSVRAECGEFAQAVEDASEGRRYGAWGGLSARQRHRQAAASIDRDRTIIALTEQGLTAAVIGAQLGVTARTVDRVRADHRRQQEALQLGSPAECGTTTAYYQHLMVGEPIDEACKAASDAYEQALTPPEPPACGTRGGYQKHRRDGEPACDACRQANADADRRLRNTGTTKAAA
ncbi:WhiB family transcriptional regulator [Streptomyces sp. NPDC056921]|uniref:WhiB family transcriptional regulator n=1 Tax=Streptomyces sp. NPDC056921 TaxID=3345966 RepID=UPI003645D90C